MRMKPKIKWLMLFALCLKLSLFCFYFFLRTPKFWAQDWFNFLQSQKDIINEIKTKKIDLDSYSYTGKTGLMQAVGSMDLDIVKAFVEAGADINRQAYDYTGDTALLIACYNANFPKMIPVIKFLLESGADASIRNKREETTLHHAMQIANLSTRGEIMQLLLESENKKPENSNKLTINAQDINGTTVLHLAVNNKEDYGVRMLLRLFGKDIDFNLKNKKQNMNPLEYADYLGFTDIEKRLKKGIASLTKK